MEKSSDGDGQEGALDILISVVVGVIVDQCFEEGVGEVGRSEGVLEPGVSGTGENVLEASELLDVPQSLEMGGINKIPDDLGKVDEAMDVVVHLSDLVWRLLARTDPAVLLELYLHALLVFPHHIIINNSNSGLYLLR